MNALESAMQTDQLRQSARIAALEAENARLLAANRYATDECAQALADLAAYRNEVTGLQSIIVEQSRDLAAANAEIAELAAKIVERGEVIDVDHHIELKLREALRETQLQAASLLLVMGCGEGYDVDVVVDHYGRLGLANVQQMHSVLARHEEADRA